jgi:hypothetical protein
MLFYIKYGCPLAYETLIVNAENIDQANLYAEQLAQDFYFSREDDYLDSENWENLCEENIEDFELNMLNDIDWLVEFFDENNNEHLKA